jgi:uncharacterized coiled-coil DUF342 family protein
MEKKIRLVDSYSETEEKLKEAEEKFHALRSEVESLNKKASSLSVLIELKEREAGQIQKVMTMKARLINLEALIDTKISELQELLKLILKVQKEHYSQEDMLRTYVHKGKPS